MSARQEPHPSFTEVTTTVFHWTRTVSAADHVAELGTLSFYRMLDPALRERLFPAVEAIIAGILELAMETRLYRARLA